MCLNLTLQRVAGDKWDKWDKWECCSYFLHTKKNNNFRKEAAHKIVAKKTLKPTIWKLIHETKRKCVYRPTDLVQLYHDPSQLIVINQQKSLTFINVTKIIDKRSGFHCLSVYVDKLTVLGPCDFIPYGNMEILTAKLPQRCVFFYIQRYWRL